MMHDRPVMDFYVGPAVLTLDNREVIGVVAFIDSARERGLYTWCGFLDTGNHDEELRFRAIESDDPQLALPGREPCLIDVVYTSGMGIGFMGTGPSPLDTPCPHS